MIDLVETRILCLAIYFSQQCHQHIMLILLLSGLVSIWSLSHLTAVQWQLQQQVAVGLLVCNSSSAQRESQGLEMLDPFQLSKKM